MNEQIKREAKSYSQLPFLLIILHMFEYHNQIAQSP